MDELTQKILDYLTPLLKVDPYKLRVVKGRPRALQNQLKSQGMFPAVIIESGRSWPTPGPFGGQIQRNFMVNVHYVVQAVNPELYDDPANDYSMSNIMDSLRTFLVQDKAVNTQDDTFRYELQSIGEQFPFDSGEMMGETLRCQWSRQEQWNGSLNYQDNLVPVTA